jgi:pimeloyl-ACP methyl ester carboxylesterase
MRHRTAKVDGIEVFYREAGDPQNPTILLLHGLPSSSHMFRDLIPQLAGDFHLVAPDLPGFGYTESPPADQFAYTFDHLAETIDGLTEALGLTRFALYVFDYGAPVGLRIAAKHPDRIAGLIVQNGNAYVEGLSADTQPLQDYWEDREAGDEGMRGLLTIDGTKFQYTAGVPEEQLERISPDAWTHDQHFLDLPGRDQAQLDLLYDYRTNVASYPAWQEYLRKHRPPTLIAWGENDPFFIVPGAEAYKRDLPDAELHLFPTGHFALETHAAEIAEKIRGFRSRLA